MHFTASNFRYFCITFLLSLLGLPIGAMPDTIAIVVNQGTFGTDNASLTRINFTTGKVDVNWFSDANNGQKLGAIANDIALKGHTAFVTVTTSRTIEVLDIRTGESLGRIQFDEPHEPWRIVLASDSLGIVSTTNGDGITVFNPSTLQVKDIIPTGPATEGVVVAGGYAFVANSGYGDFRQNEPNAGTVAVVDLAKLQVERYLSVGPNVRELALSNDGKRLYAFYQHLYSKPDSLQGIVEYDVETLRELRRWRLHSAGALHFFNGTLYVLNYNPSDYSSSHIIKLDPLRQTPPGQPPIVDSIALPRGVSAYGFTINHFDSTILVFDARDYQSNGRVLMLSAHGNVLREYPTGIAPVKAAVTVVTSPNNVAISQYTRVGVYPNPATGWCMITLGYQERGGTLVLRDALGKHIWECLTDSEQDHVMLKLENYAPGVYSVVFSNYHTVTTLPLIIVR